MRCLICQKLSITLMCKTCVDNITILPHKRIQDDGFRIYSFFDYHSIEYLIKTKYSIIGSRIYKILARRAFLYFNNNISLDVNRKLYAIGIDDRIKSYYSHTGVIINEFRKLYHPLFGALIASNNVQYAGMNLEFRKRNKRNFIYKGPKNIDAILFDDVVTTGITISEARQVLSMNGVNVIFALVLSDVN